MFKTVSIEKSNYTPETGANDFNIHIDGYKAIAVTYAGTNTGSNFVIATRVLSADNVDFRFSDTIPVIFRFGILYIKMDEDD